MVELVSQSDERQQMTRHRIDGKVYDEETSDLVHEYESRLPRDDFRWVYERLYKSQSGQFFVAGRGGPKSDFAETEDERNWSSGEGAYTLEPEEALEWLVSRGAKIEVIEEHFTMPVG